MIVIVILVISIGYCRLAAGLPKDHGPANTDRQLPHNMKSTNII